MSQGADNSGMPVLYPRVVWIQVYREITLLRGKNFMFSDLFFFPQPFLCFVFFFNQEVSKILCNLFILHPNYLVIEVVFPFLFSLAGIMLK